MRNNNYKAFSFRLDENTILDLRKEFSKFKGSFGSITKCWHKSWNLFFIELLNEYKKGGKKKK